MSPWRVVLSLIEHFEQALVVMTLFEGGGGELVANGETLADVLGCTPSERAVAGLLARRMLEIEGGTWTYEDFYVRGNLRSTSEEVRAFVELCGRAGVTLGYV